MPYQSISALRHRYLQRDYTGNRSEEPVDQLESYRKDVSGWARTSKSRMHKHCQTLKTVAANPGMLQGALNKLNWQNDLFGLSKNEFITWHRWGYLRDLQKDLLNGNFRRGKYLKYKIPKPGKTGFRLIEIPSFETRLVSRCLLDLMVPIFDPDFYPLSIGFRPKRSLYHGFAAARRLADEFGLLYWIKCDLKDAFGQIPKNRMLQILNSRLHNSPVIGLIKELLDRHRQKGIPQGLSISPLILNIYLDHLLDHWWVKKSPQTCLIRYADDLLIACPSINSAYASYETLKNRIQTIGFKLKENQEEAIYNLAEGEKPEWLGCRIQKTEEGLQATLGESSWANLEFKLKEISRKGREFEHISGGHIRAIGEGWITQKSLAIREQELPSVTEKFCSLADQSGLSKPNLSDQMARAAWGYGQKLLEKAQTELELPKFDNH